LHHRNLHIARKATPLFRFTSTGWKAPRRYAFLCDSHKAGENGGAKAMQSAPPDPISDGSAGIRAHLQSTSVPSDRDRPRPETTTRRGVMSVTRTLRKPAQRAFSTARTGEHARPDDIEHRR
jgi:hypothetical protein